MKHPGTITFVEKGKPDEVLSVEEVPETVAFYEEGPRRVPVVRVVAELVGTKRVIRSYGADGALLTTTREA